MNSMIQTVKLEKAALKLLKNNLKIQKNEKILVVTDRKNCRVCNAVFRVSQGFSKNVVAVHISDKRSNSGPLPKLKQLFSSVDVIIAPTTKSISHSPETRVARKRHGVRVASMPKITGELFVKAFTVSVAQQKAINGRLLKKLRGKRVRVTNKSGTDLTIGINKQKFDSDDGDCSKKGSLRNIPSGEVSAAPISDVNGKLCIDVWNGHLKPKNIKLEIANGKIVGYSKEAAQFITYLRKNGECATYVVELGIGTNPKHRKPIGNILHDEKILGSAHIAFGGFGNLRKCPIHEDVIIMKPTIQVDRKTIMENGLPKW